MPVKIEKASGAGFCFGVRRAIETVERVARERGGVETLGAIVHNQQVVQKLAGIGVRVANSVDDIQGNTVVIGAHGVSPKLMNEIRAHHTQIIDTTCPFVHRAQIAARRLAKSGFFVIIYGEANHPEVKGILGWADDNGLATLDEDFTATFQSFPRRLGVLSQTTQIPARFNEFVKTLIDSALAKDSELRIIDTICHDIRQRQESALGLAQRVDLMLVIGSHTSANTNHLAELCATTTRTYLVESAAKIQSSWLRDHQHIGITSGASTAEETINEVLAKLETLTSLRG